MLVAFVQTENGGIFCYTDRENVEVTWEQEDV